ncbi:MAG: hypothetical protein AAF652_21620 [Cyanobacteria bacterium P01_C01_bin.72]
MQSKKTWQKPQLTIHGSIESVTQAKGSLKKISGLITAGKGISAILSI